ncbi:Protein GLUTAMINE DUMPER 2, partial [Mucuna pruriens]
MNSSIGESGAAGFKNLSSPIPYLFGGLALMLAVIAVALLVLACFYRTQYYSPNSTSDEEKPPNNVLHREVNVSDPKIVVIMAGDSNPTYFANPVPSTTHNQQPVSN